MIVLRKLYKSFGDHDVLNGVDLSVSPGSTCVIIGRSGCGKSVLLKHIIGLMRPDAGQVLVFGKDIAQVSASELSALRMRIGMVFQAGALFDSLSVEENVAFGLTEHQRLARKELQARVEEALGLVGLCGIGTLMPSELSGGMKKRVSLARALCIRPEVILYDEPTTGVDPITADGINELILSLHDKLKVTSIVVTHDMKSAYKVGDTVAMLYQGRILTQGTPEEIQRSRDPVVHQFINGLSQGPVTDTFDCRKTVRA